MVNTLHCQVSDGGWTTDDRDTFNSAWTTFVDGFFRSMYSSEVHQNEIRYYNLPSTSGPLGDPAFITTTAHNGTGSASATLPPQCAITVTWKTAVRRRWGRIYLGGLVTGNVDDGRISSDALSSIGSTIDVFGTTLRSNGQGIVVWHRASWTPQDVTDFTIDDVWDVQRRRRYAHAFNRYDGSFV
jgi:hypothetical protein